MPQGGDTIVDEIIPRGVSQSSRFVEVILTSPDNRFSVCEQPIASEFSAKPTCSEPKDG